MQRRGAVKSEGPEKAVAGPESGRIHGCQGELPSQRGPVQKGQCAQGEKKESQGRDPARSLGSGHPAGGKPAECPHSQREQGWARGEWAGQVSELWLGGRIREDLHSLGGEWPGLLGLQDPLIHMQIPLATPRLGPK